MEKKYYSRPQAEVKASRLRMTILAGSNTAAEVGPMEFEDETPTPTPTPSNEARSRTTTAGLSF